MEVRTLKAGWDFFQNEVLGMQWLSRLIGSALSACGIDPAGRVGGSIQFFLYDTVKIMVLAQVVLITPLVVGNMETYVAGIAPAVRETAKGLGLGGLKTFGLLCNECVYPIVSAYLLAFARSIAEVGAVSMVGGAISWKTNVMTTAIMQYTNRGNFSLGIALGMILLAVSLLVNIVISLLQRRLSR